MSSTHDGIVAENNKFWVFLLVCFWMYSNIFSMSYWKPCFNISSASSSTVTFKLFSFMISLSRRSRRRPGVATIISAPSRISRICSCISAPPYTLTTLNSESFRRMLLISCLTWIASYLVGNTISILVLLLLNSSSLLNLSITGSEKAIVLPDPVRSLAIRSFPSVIVLNVSYWMGKKYLMPFFCRTSIILEFLMNWSRRPNSAGSFVLPFCPSGDFDADYERSSWCFFFLRWSSLELLL